MICNSCGSSKFYIEQIDRTRDYNFKDICKKDIEDNLEQGAYVDYDWEKSEILVKCSKCNKEIEFDFY